MFFTEKKKKTGRRKKNKKQQGNWLTRNVFRPLSLFCLMIIVAMIVLTPRLKKSLPDLQTQEKYRFTEEQIELVGQPAWVPHHFVRDVLKQREVPRSILEPKLAESLSKWFAAEPWVQSVDEVRVSFPPHAQVKLTFREPVACLSIEGKRYPIDRHGVLLPPDDLSLSEMRRYPVLQLDTEQQMVALSIRPGEAITDDRVRQGCKLAAKLKPFAEEFDFEAIRSQPVRHQMVSDNERLSSSRNPEPIFEILSASGSVIIWGRAPGTTHPGELKADQKVGRLKVYQERFKGFALPDGPYEIDITHWTDISRKPLKKTAQRRNHPFR